MSSLATKSGERRSSEGRQLVLACSAVLGSLLALRYSIFSWGIGLLREDLTPFAVCLGFAVLAYLSRGVTGPGAIAGFAIAWALYGGLGLWAFLLLVVVFVLTWVATRAGRSRKRAIMVRDDTRGRNASQVLANLGIAGIAAILGFLLASPPWVLGSLAALSEAAADTVSSEVGEAFGGQARLITSAARVAPGTDGAITPLGTIAGVFAALTTAICAWIFTIPLRGIVLVATSGILGMLFDSLLGATLERRGLIGNNLVNFASTAFAAMLAVGTAVWFNL